MDCRLSRAKQHIRYSLNYKNIPFETVWIEYPDIADFCKKVGAAPTATRRDSSLLYTLPVIRDPSTGTVLSDSPGIAVYLDNTYPDRPTLFPPGTKGLHAVFKPALFSVLDELYDFTLPASNAILNPKSEAYFRSTREKAFGKKIEDITPKGEDRVKHWRKVENGFGIVDGWYAKGGGTYIMGDVPCFADIEIISWLQYVKVTLGEDSQEWKDIRSWNNGRWAKLFDSFVKYE